MSLDSRVRPGMRQTAPPGRGVWGGTEGPFHRRRRAGRGCIVPQTTPAPKRAHDRDYVRVYGIDNGCDVGERASGRRYSRYVLISYVLQQGQRALQLPASMLRSGNDEPRRADRNRVADLPGARKCDARRRQGQTRDRQHTPPYKLLTTVRHLRALVRDTRCRRGT